MSNLIKYGNYEADDAEADLTENEEARQGDWWKPKPGRNVIRVLPPRIGARRPFRIIWQHYTPIPGQQTKVAIICPLLQAKSDGIVGGRFCPVCQQVEDLLAEGAETEAKDMKANREILYNVIDRGNESRGVLIYKARPTVHEAIIALRTADPSGPAYCDPASGFDIVIQRKGMGLDTKYTVTPLRGPAPLHEDVAVANAWLQSMHDLDKHARILTDDELRQKLSGGGGRRGGGGGNSGGRSRDRNFGGGSAPRGRTAADDMNAIDTDGVEVP